MDLGETEPGLCVRIDHIADEDAATLASLIQEQAPAELDVEARVLDVDALDPPAISPERAIEIRNRKQTRLFLVVPARMGSGTASSLENAFAAFDLEGAFERIARTLFDQLGSDERSIAVRVREQLRGHAAVTAERWADYLASILEAETGRVQTAGLELWRVGLIPDGDAGTLTERLPDNRRSVLALSRPPSAQASLAARLETLGLRPGEATDRLSRYLNGKRLRDARGWLRPIAQDRELTFDRWEFETQQTDLIEITVEPLLDEEGRVQRFTGIAQPGGPGSVPVAEVGARKRVTIKWASQPSSPDGVERWQAELVPAEEEYASGELPPLDLPSVTVARTRSQAKVPLDVDLQATDVRAVQVRVTALDAYGSEIRHPESEEVVEGRSGEFWLEEEVEVPPEDSAPRARVVHALPFARLQTAVEVDEEVQEAPGHWTSGDEDRFTISFNRRYTTRLAVSPILRRIEELRLAAAANSGYFVLKARAGERADPSEATFVTADALDGSETGTRLAAKRRAVFRELTRDPGRPLVEVADWNDDLTRAVRAYAAAYRESLGAASTPDVLRDLLLLDTLQLSVEHPEDVLHSVVVLPTHPLRMLWYAAYADLLRSWEAPLSRLGRDEVGSALDIDLVGRLEPMNLPALAVDLSGEPVLFSHNLTFFWAIHVEADVRDPGRHVASAAIVLGAPGDEDVFGDIPPRRLSDELQAYRDVHPYLETLRLAALNPGTGKFLADALRPLVISGVDPIEDTDPGSEPTRPLRVEVLAHTDEPIPFELPGLARFEREVYENRVAGEPHHLAPLFSLALRSRSQVTSPPGGEVNLTIAFDAFRPRIEIMQQTQSEDSSSFYGLLTRMSSSFIAGEGDVRWQHSVHLSPDRTRERHPVVAAYTNELIDGQDAFLGAVGNVAGGGAHGRPAVVLEIDPESRSVLDGLHASSDWVAFLDRFLGVEFFDYPRDVDLERVSRRYLLDYSPEFVEGLGHRLLVTTAHREEVAEILGRAMTELGLGAIEDSVGDVLHHLKTISGRLALRVVGDTSRAREAASLGIVAAYLRSRGELEDAILVPVDAHPELFGVHARPAGGTARQRCDLIRVRFGRGRLQVTFIEVKSRGAGGQAEELANRIVDQIDATEQVFRDLFFQRDPVRLDHTLQRARLATILRFYLQRAWRHRLISTEERLAEMHDGVERLDTGIPNMHAEKWGFVVNLGAEPAPPHKLRGALIHVITAHDVQEAGLSTDLGFSSDRPSPDLTTQPEAKPATGPEPEPPPSEPEPEPDAPRDTESDASTAEPAAVAGPSGPTTESDAKEGASADEGDLAADTPEPRPQELEILLGTTPIDDEPVVWRPSVRGSPHLFILGIPGQGKSWTATRLLLELVAQDVPALVFDFHGQFSDPDGPYFRAASPAILDAAAGLPFSPFEAESSADAGANFWRTNAFVVAEIFEYVCGLGDMQRDVVYEAVRDSYQAAGFGGEGPTRLPTVAEVAHRLGELEVERRVRNVVPRCRPLLEFGLFSDDSGSSQDGFIELLRQGAVLDTSRQGLEELQLASGAFVLRKVYKEMFRWGETDRLRLVLVLDEAHRLARDITLPKLMKEGRKFGVAAVVASQGLADFHPDVVGNAGTKVVFRTNFPMSKKVAGFLRGPQGIDLAGAIEQLEVGEAYAQTPEMPRAARVKMEPLREPGG